MKKKEKQFPRVSVIIPLFNHEKFIGRCLRSLLSQTLDKNEFEIINFKEAISHDFQLYNTGQRRIDHLIQFGEFFSKKEIFDEISFALYQELIWKSTQLKKARIFEKEKKKLIRNAKEKKLLGHDRYRAYLMKQIKSNA